MEMQIKTTLTFYSPQSEWQSSQKQTSNTGEQGEHISNIMKNRSC
jgi:hypothetical protein